MRYKTKDEHGYKWPYGDSFSGYMWLSFVEPGEGSLGVIITESNNIIDATKKLWDMELNPGGEVMALPLNQSLIDKLPDIDDYVDRLMDASEAEYLQSIFEN